MYDVMSIQTFPNIMQMMKIVKGLFKLTRITIKKRLVKNLNDYYNVLNDF